MSNKYIKRSRLSEVKTRVILRFFVCDIEASKIADLTGIRERRTRRKQIVFGLIKHGRKIYTQQV